MCWANSNLNGTDYQAILVILKSKQKIVEPSNINFLKMKINNHMDGHFFFFFQSIYILLLQFNDKRGIERNIIYRI